MTDRPLFRQEAVEHHARGTVANRRDLDLSNRTTTRAFQLLVLVVVAALVTAFTVEADEATRGEAIVTPAGAVVVIAPIGALERLRVGQPVSVELGGKVVEGQVASIGKPVAEGGAAFVPLETSIRTQVGEADGQGVVTLDRRKIADILLPGLRSFFGDRSA